MRGIVNQSEKFDELRAYYTQKDINDAKSENKLFFFDVGYFSSLGMEHEGYSIYYKNIDELLENAYNFIKKYKDIMLAGDRYIHLRSVVEIIPDFGLAGNGYIFGYVSLIHTIGKEDKIKISLDKKLDYCIDDFINKHDDIERLEELEEQKKLIKKG